MTTHRNVPFETLVELVRQLSPQQQQILLQQIQRQLGQNGQSVEEKMHLLRSAQIDVPVNQEPSPRREDWYSDDGR